MQHLGANAFTVEAKDIAGNLNTFATTVTRAEIPPEVIQLSVKPGEQLKIDSKGVRPQFNTIKKEWETRID